MIFLSPQSSYVTLCTTRPCSPCYIPPENPAAHLQSPITCVSHIGLLMVSLPCSCLPIATTVTVNTTGRHHCSAHVPLGSPWLARWRFLWRFLSHKQGMRLPVYLCSIHLSSYLASTFLLAASASLVCCFHHLECSCPG